MNRAQIADMLRQNVPFTIQMADGKEYHIPHRDYISLPPKGSLVVVWNDEGRMTFLPLLTMTGLTCQSDHSSH